MSVEQTTHLQRLVDRLRQGDENARNELFEHTYERLTLLARHIFRSDFPRLKHVLETGSVIDEALLRMLKVLRELRIDSLQDYFRFAAAQIRRVLLDRCRRQRFRDHPQPVSPEQAEPGECTTPWNEPMDTSCNPADLAIWTEFHQRVQELPEDERMVVDLHWYQGLTQVEAAKVLGIHPREVSRRWVHAKLLLADAVPNLDSFLGPKG